MKDPAVENWFSWHFSLKEILKNMEVVVCLRNAKLKFNPIVVVARDNSKQNLVPNY